MKLICAQQGIVSLLHPGQGIRDLKNVGFTDVLLDLTVCVPPMELERYEKKRQFAGSSVKLDRESRKAFDRQKRRELLLAYPEDVYDYLKPVLDQYASAGIQTSVARAPCFQKTTNQENMRQFMERLTAECIRASSQAGCTGIVVKPLETGIAPGDLWEVNRAFYLHLARELEGTELVILLENQSRDINGHLVRGVCAESREAVLWVDELNKEIGEERFGFCMDTGICNVCGQNMYEFVHALGSRLKAVVLRDCDGIEENSLLPFTCVKRGKQQTDWLNLIRGLRAVHFDGYVILDFVDTVSGFSPLLRQELLRLAKAVGDYFIWQTELERHMRQYSSIVLFGAGNMCRNYMMYYGNRYPPMFTCDNNPTLWGKEFCGLTVKNPQSLQELPKSCAIFICNMFYREIEKQIKDMGIKNPIEFFSDEFMPATSLE